MTENAVLGWYRVVFSQNLQKNLLILKLNGQTRSNHHKAAAGNLKARRSQPLANHETSRALTRSQTELLIPPTIAWRIGRTLNLAH